MNDTRKNRLMERKLEKSKSYWKEEKEKKIFDEKFCLTFKKGWRRKERMKERKKERKKEVQDWEISKKKKQRERIDRVQVRESCCVRRKFLFKFKRSNW